jgi:hypothetical protein
MNEGIAPFLSPITLLLGAGLFVTGFLTLIDLDFFKTKTQGLAALTFGLLFLVATEAMFVTSGASGRYFEGQKLDVTDCEYQAERDYPAERRENPRIVHDKIVACMDALGYDWNDSHDHCVEARLATNPFCYMPRAPMQRAIVAFQMRFE